MRWLVLGLNNLRLEDESSYLPGDSCADILVNFNGTVLETSRLESMKRADVFVLWQ